MADPFIKWAGGKRQLLSELEKRMPEKYNTYYEPFIGGGALLLDVMPEKAVINDRNGQLLNVYRQISANAEEVLKILRIMNEQKCTEERYKQARMLFNRYLTEDRRTPESAALFIWLNKHCFNGLYRVNKKGEFNVPWNQKETNPGLDEENIRGAGTYLKTVDIMEGGYAEATAGAKPGDLVYFDPPYIPVSSTSSFVDYTAGGFGADEQKALAKEFRRLDKAGVQVMLSNNDVPEISELYKGYRIERISARRAINRNASKRTGKEVLVRNY